MWGSSSLYQVNVRLRLEGQKELYVKMDNVPDTTTEPQVWNDQVRNGYFLCLEIGDMKLLPPFEKKIVFLENRFPCNLIFHAEEVYFCLYSNLI